jgi:rRNA-processing protein FCF1
MGIGQFKIDIFTEIDNICDFPYEFAVLDKTVEELKKLEESSKGKQGEAARLALRIIRAHHITIIKTEPGHTDDKLVELSKNNAIIVTQDKALKKRLTRPYITIRQKKKVMMVE